MMTRSGKAFEIDQDSSGEPFADITGIHVLRLPDLREMVKALEAVHEKRRVAKQDRIVTNIRGVTRDIATEAGYEAHLSALKFVPAGLGHWGRSLCGDEISWTTILTEAHVSKEGADDDTG